MVAFPLIPILAYTLIISAFSYLSARILKRFSFSSHLLAFLRRQGRLTPLPITDSHELLPTSTASPLTRPSIGVYAGSSNVTPRSTSLDVSSVLPPRLISPASSPPGHPQPRRVTNPPFTSFSILKPTLYRHKQRRSRSLCMPISRPPHWSSHFLPSPPMQRAAVRRRNSEEDIPLSILSQTADYLSHEHRTLVPAPILYAPSMSTSMPDSDFHSSIYGPLIDISLPPLSPVSTSLSSRQNSSLAGLSYSGSELASSSYPTSSDSGSPYSISGSAQSSDIGVQPIGDLRGFAYDWRVNNENSDEDDSRGNLHEPSPFPLTIGEHVVTVVTEKQGNEDVSHDSQSGEIAEKAAYDATQMDLVQASAPEQLDAPPLADNVGQSALTSSVLSQSDPNIDEEIPIDQCSPPILELPTPSTPDRLEDDANLSSLVGGDREFHVDGMIMERLDDDVWNEPNVSILLAPPCATVQDINVEERPLIAIDTSGSVKSSDGLPAKPLLMSPSQTPTPPASPPLTLISAAKASTGGGKSQIRVTAILPTSEPASPANTTEEITETTEEPFASSPVSQELGQGGPEYDGSIIEDITSPARSDVSPTCSPSNALPSWSIRAADAPPLGLSVTQAASVQDEVLWPAKAEDVQIREADEESENSTEKSIQSVAEGQDPSVPGTFPVLKSKEPTLAQKQVVNEPASSTTVTTAPGLRRRRQVVRGLPIDVALAMQLRPGLGVGADPAWMVRFLMAVFGWFAIMIAGRGGEVDAYAHEEFF
ncbi:hypothetical protein APHAL10511_007207 [Amanita phalloides]|nr:hypothetical protein APHAL10511_007207 [Amanita phalloides]